MAFRLYLWASITFCICIGVTLWLFNAERISRIQLVMDHHDWSGVKYAVDHCRMSSINNKFANMTFIKNCTTPLYQLTNEIDTAAKSEMCAACSRDLFKKFYSYSSDFLHDGFWNMEMINGTSMHVSFQPSICKFSTKPLDSKFIRKCLAEKNITKIVTMGDSNGKLTSTGLRAVLSAGIKPCNKIRQETNKRGPRWPDVSYYLRGREYNMKTDVAVAQRRCGSCIAELYNCSYELEKSSTPQNDRILILEHLAMNEVYSNDMRVIRTIEDITPTNYSQEIILKYYLKDNYPDILILVMPCAHEALSKNLESGKGGARLTGHLQKFLDLLKKTVPKSTQIFWIPSHYFFPPPKYVSKIQLCNKILFETIKDEIAAPNSNMHATLNLFELGCSMGMLRNPKDNAHMTLPWYMTVANHLMEQLCN